MDNISELVNTAIMLIYPEGGIDRLPIDKDRHHMKYFLKLLNKSSYFSDIIKKNNINLANKSGELSDISTYELDANLTELGIIVVRNLDIPEIQKDQNFLEHSFPQYTFSIPKNFSTGQNKIMNKLLNDYDLQECWFFHNSGDGLEDIEYDDVIAMITNKKSK